MFGFALFEDFADWFVDLSIGKKNVRWVLYKTFGNKDYCLWCQNFKVEKFDGMKNFNMWQCKIMDALIPQELYIALKDKTTEMLEKDWEKINRPVCGTIWLCVAKDQKHFVMRETRAKKLWRKLEDTYMTKSVENWLYIKKRLFCFQYHEFISMYEHVNWNFIIDNVVLALRGGSGFSHAFP